MEYELLRTAIFECSIQNQKWNTVSQTATPVLFDIRSPDACSSDVRLFEARLLGVYPTFLSDHLRGYMRCTSSGLPQAPATFVAPVVPKPSSVSGLLTSAKYKETSCSYITSCEHPHGPPAACHSAPASPALSRLDLYKAPFAQLQFTARGMERSTD